MRVVSVNAWCGGMLKPLMEWLPVCQADVLCVQEVTWTPGYDGWVTYVDPDRTLEQRASLFQDLRRALPDYQAHFFTCDTGPVLCQDGVVRRQHFGIATLIAPHLPVVGSEAAFVHGKFAHHDTWPPEDRGRMAHAVRVDGGDAGIVTVAHLHGVRMSSGKGDTPERLRQAEEVVALVSRVRGPDDLVVVAGDLNLLPDSQSFHIFGAAGLTDLVGGADTRTSAYTKASRHAGYLLVSNLGMVSTFEVLVEPEVSDHRPLIVDLRPASPVHLFDTDGGWRIYRQVGQFQLSRFSAGENGGDLLAGIRPNRLAVQQHLREVEAGENLRISEHHVVREACRGHREDLHGVQAKNAGLVGAVGGDGRLTIGRCVVGSALAFLRCVSDGCGD